MKSVPYPYNDELVYSVLARARVHFLILSPKHLIEQVFGRRTNIATTDLPSHLEKLSSQYVFSNISSEILIYQHTLFPLYAPFMPHERKVRCVEWMRGKASGATHLATGQAASRLPSKRYTYYCPHCVKEQVKIYGEAYWLRTHQVTGISTCIKHNIGLQIAPNCSPKVHRHEYFPASSSLIKGQVIEDRNTEDMRLAKQLTALLNLGEIHSPTYAQWSRYYFELCKRHNWVKGKYVDYQPIAERLLSVWPHDWLRRYNIYPTNSQSNWLHCMLRKHRKAFSYLEHLVLLETLLGNDWGIEQVLLEASKLEPNVKTIERVNENHIPASLVRRHKLKWLAIVCRKGTKEGRRTKKGGAMYAWLYRHQRKWLLKTNLHFKRDAATINNRVDWEQRDKALVKRLILIRNSIEDDISIPRQSKKWFIQQLPQASSVEKYLQKLPLTLVFLNRYQESITEYQIRRFTRELINPENRFLPLWALHRKAGLSNERMTPLSKQFMRTARFSLRK